MKLAIPVLNGRVAPRLCFAKDIVLFDLQTLDYRDVSTEYLRLDVQPTFLELSRLLKKKGVDVVLCCGVNRQAYYLLNAMGIETVPGLMGDVRQVVDDFLASLGAGRRGNGNVAGKIPGPGGKRKKCLGPRGRRRRRRGSE